MKKIVSLFLAAALLLGFSATAFAINMQSRAVIGANLDQGQIAQVYQAFGIQRGYTPELYVTNSEERMYLEGLVDEAVIGTLSISCVYVELLPAGTGMDVTTSNPRTAIGQRADGAVIFLCIDGRQASSLGGTYRDIIDIMVEYGAVNACNMDGGSSSVMMYLDSQGRYGEAGEYVMINSYSLLQSEPRRMPNFWMVRPAEKED